jgi:hypothetical protein
MNEIFGKWVASINAITDIRRIVGRKKNSRI